MKKTSGFTLIELLVVIAIIGILSGVVLTSLNSTRGKGRVAVVQQQFSAAQKAALSCIDDGKNLYSSGTTVIADGAALTNVTAGNTMCSGSSASWPTLPTQGSWGTYQATNSVAAGTFQFKATGDGKTITCTESGCVTN